MQEGVVIRNVAEIAPEILRQGKLWELASQKDGKEGSAGLLEITSPNRSQYTKTATRFYFIIDGEGEIVVVGEIYPIKKGTFCRIPSRKIHQFIPKESLVVIVFSVPAFSEEDTVFLNSTL